jgi:hypothetical protein
MRTRSTLLLCLSIGSALVLPRAAAAACEQCKLSPFPFSYNQWCVEVYDPETGVTACTDGLDPLTGSLWCFEEGNACSVVNVGGGGGGTGGGGGGGGGSCNTAGYCPAECFSCGGGGGRPAV